MQTLTTAFTGNTGQLNSELLAANPGWRTLITEGPHAGRYLANYAFTEKDGQITLTFPDETDPLAVRRVIVSHVPDPLYGRDLDAEADRAVLQAAMSSTKDLTAKETSAALKAALRQLSKRGGL